MCFHYSVIFYPSIYENQPLFLVTRIAQATSARLGSSQSPPPGSGTRRLLHAVPPTMAKISNMPTTGVLPHRRCPRTARALLPTSLPPPPLQPSPYGP